MARTGRFTNDSSTLPTTTDRPERTEQLREREAAIKGANPAHVTHDEAAQLPQSARNDPAVRQHVAGCSQHWPERRMPASQVLTDLPPGEGGQVERRDIDAASLFGKGET